MKESRQAIAKQNLLELEKALAELRNEIALADPAEVATIKDDKGGEKAVKNKYQLLCEEYNALWEIKIGLEKNTVDKKKIIAGVLTPIIGLLVAWAGREIVQSAFWRDLAREVTRVKF